MIIALSILGVAVCAAAIFLIVKLIIVGGKL